MYATADPDVFPNLLSFFLKFSHIGFNSFCAFRELVEIPIRETPQAIFCGGYCFIDAMGDTPVRVAFSQSPLSTRERWDTIDLERKRMTSTTTEETFLLTLPTEFKRFNMTSSAKAFNSLFNCV